MSKVRNVVALLPIYLRIYFKSSVKNNEVLGFDRYRGKQQK